jgi:hypothetical protein
MNFFMNIIPDYWKKKEKKSFIWKIQDGGSMTIKCLVITS